MRDAVRKLSLRNLLIAGVFVFMTLVGHTAYWLHHTIYDNQRFTTISTEAITAETSRQSIGTTVVNQALADRPIVRQTVGPRLSQMIAALLGTDLAHNVINTVVEHGHLIVTTPRREPLTLNTTTLKQQIAALQAVIGTDEESRRLDVSQVPDEIMILDTNNIPNIHQYGIAVLWVGTLSILLVVGSASWYIYRARGVARLTRTRQVLVLLIVSSIVALLVGPLVRPVFLTVAENAPAQTLLRNIFDGFIAPFNAQAISVGLVASAVLALSIIIPVSAVSAQVKQSKATTKSRKTTS